MRTVKSILAVICLVGVGSKAAHLTWRIMHQAVTASSDVEAS
jgi:hypothetical protein